jgi:uncharacterized protein (TIGR03435 family)
VRIKLAGLTLSMVAGLTHAQETTATRPEFEVSSVKENHSGRAGYDGFQVSHGSLTVRNVSLMTLIETAYETQAVRISGGPPWSNSDRYDILARGSADATKQQVWLMLRSLLASRFKLDLRINSKELPICSLEVEKGKSGLPKRSTADCGPGPASSQIKGQPLP